MAKQRATDGLTVDAVRAVLDTYPQPVSTIKLQQGVASEFTDGDLQGAKAMITVAEDRGVVEQTDGGYVSTDASSLATWTGRTQCRRLLLAALSNRETALLAGLPSAGRATGARDAAETADVPVVYLTHQHDTSAEQTTAPPRTHRLPTLDRDCPAATGAHGTDTQEKIEDSRGRGITDRRLHELLDLPCGAECPYVTGWEFDPDKYDRLVGRPVHANHPTLTRGTAVVFDADPGQAFETTVLAGQAEETVTAYLEQRDEIGVETTAELRNLRETEQARRDASSTLRKLCDQRDEQFALDTPDGHAAAPLLALALLDGVGLGNGFERVTHEGIIGVYDRNSGQITVCRPPDLSGASAVVGLAQTPVHETWERRLGIDLDSWHCLTDTQRAAYVSNSLSLDVVQTTLDNNPYSSGTWVNETEDKALVRAIHQKHDEIPGVITTRQAGQALCGDGGPLAALLRDDDVGHFDQVETIARFAGRTVGCILGSPHPGDRAIKRLAALDGHSVERQTDSRDGEQLSYGETGDKYLHSARERPVAQAVRCFGQGPDTTVYVNTAAVPDWLVTAEVSGYLGGRSETELSIMRALLEAGTATTSVIQDHEGVAVSRRQVREHLSNLERDGLVSKSGKTKGTTWHDEGLAEALGTPHVDLT